MADQLERAFRECEHRGHVAGATALLDRVETRLNEEIPSPLDAPSRGRWWSTMPGPAVAFAAAVAVLLIVVGGVWLFGGFGSSEFEPIEEPQEPVTTITVAPPTSVAAPTPTIGRVTTTTVSPPFPAAVPDITWRRVDVGGGFVNGLPEGDQRYGAITVVESDLVIVGSVVDIGGGSGEPRYAVWRSSDGGETWKEIDVGGLAEQPAWTTWNALPALAAAPDGTFVVAESDADDAWVWVTTDLEAWRKSDSPDLGGPGTQAIFDIAYVDDRFVAVGDDVIDAAVWVSPDGLAWSQVLDDDFSSDLVGSAVIWGVDSGGPGLVAVGAAGASGGFGATDLGQVEHGAIWVSSDGLEWDLLPFVDDPSGYGLASVSSDPDGRRLIAFGGDWWVSDDGGSEWAWYDRTVPFGGPPPGASAAWIGDVAVAGGWDAAFSLWTSGDAGLTWHRVDPELPEFEGCTQIADVVAFGDRFVAVGPTAESCWADEWTAAAWIGTIND